VRRAAVGGGRPLQPPAHQSAADVEYGHAAVAEIEFVSEGGRLRDRPHAELLPGRLRPTNSHEAVLEGIPD